MFEELEFDYNVELQRKGCVIYFENFTHNITDDCYRCVDEFATADITPVRRITLALITIRENDNSYYMAVPLGCKIDSTSIVYIDDKKFMVSESKRELTYRVIALENKKK